MSKKCGEDCSCYNKGSVSIQSARESVKKLKESLDKDFDWAFSTSPAKIQMDIVCKALDNVIDSVEGLIKKTDHLIENTPPSSDNSVKT